MARSGPSREARHKWREALAAFNGQTLGLYMLQEITFPKAYEVCVPEPKPVHRGMFDLRYRSPAIVSPSHRIPYHHSPTLLLLSHRPNYSNSSPAMPNVYVFLETAIFRATTFFIMLSKFFFQQVAYVPIRHEYVFSYKNSLPITQYFTWPENGHFQGHKISYFRINSKPAWSLLAFLPNLQPPFFSLLFHSNLRKAIISAMISASFKVCQLSCSFTVHQFNILDLLSLQSTNST